MVNTLANQLLQSARSAHTNLTMLGPDLVLRQTEAANEGLDLELGHLLTHLHGHVNTLDQSEFSINSINQSEISVNSINQSEITTHLDSNLPGGGQHQHLQG